jgi:hypothetical protein
MQGEQEAEHLNKAMKTKLKISTAVVLFLFSAAACALAQFNTGPGVPGSQPQAIDPTTGQPTASPTEQWIDPAWPDNMQLTNVSYDGVPVSEVARDLRTRFKEQFDVLLPHSAPEKSVNPFTGEALEAVEWTATPIRLQMRNVSSIDIFNAMNLMFENDKTPLRWQLKINGTRGIAILRILAIPNPNADAPKDVQRRVYFVGNLIGDEKNGGMTMEQIIKTVTDVWKMADASGKGVTTSARGVEISGGTIQFHKDAQLLVVTGTVSQIDFMEQTLKALEQKVNQGKIAQVKNTALQEILKNVEQDFNQQKTNAGAPAR